MGGGLRKLAGMKDGTIEHVGFRQRGAMLHAADHEQGRSRASAGASGAVAAEGYPRVGDALAPAPLPTNEMLARSGEATGPMAAASAIDQSERDSPAAASSTRPRVRPSHRAAAAAGSGAMKVARVHAKPTAAAQGVGASAKPKATAASEPGAGGSARFSSAAAAIALGKGPLAGEVAARRYSDALGSCAAASAASARQLFLALRPSKAGSSPPSAAASAGAGGASCGSNLRFPESAGMDVAGLLAPAKRTGGRSTAAEVGFPLQLGARTAGKQAPMQVTVFAGRKRKPSERR